MTSVRPPNPGNAMIRTDSGLLAQPQDPIPPLKPTHRIDFVRKNEDAYVPTRGTEHSAGYDLYSMDGFELDVGEEVFLDTGVAFEIPQGYFGAVKGRSGMSRKWGIEVHHGTIDADYRGTVGIIMRRLSNGSQGEPDTPAVFTKGTRIGQIVFQPYYSVPLNEVQELSDTVRGTGGFGSTGN